MKPENIYDFTLGIVGGGQLGKMLAQQGKTLGISVVVLDPTPGSPAGEVCDEQIVGHFFDRKGFLELAKKSDIVTYEFEHISSTYLEELEKMGYIVRPSSKSLSIIQDKRKQKEFLQNNNIPVVSFMSVDEYEDLKEGVAYFSCPIMLKSSRGGYDGKGNYLIEESSEEELQKAYRELGGEENSLYLEDFIDFKLELSVMVGRNEKGEIVNYPIVNNVHKDSILHSTSAPAKITREVKLKTEEISRKVMDLFGDVGIFGIEFFLGKDDSIYVNEIAPRPHNSGHYSIEGCDISQFETHLRAIMGLPLKEPRLICPAVMKNLLGRGEEGSPVVKGLDKALNIEGLCFHLYRKKKSRPNRKMGHFTVLGDTLEDAEAKALKAFEILEISGQ